MLSFFLLACAGSDKDSGAVVDSDPVVQDSDSGSGSDSGSDSGGGGEVDFSGEGPFSVAHSSGSDAVATDCDMDWDRYTPQGGDTPEVLVILAHGFQRSRANMAGWGEHLATWGLDVVTPDLCHASAFDADHAQNGADLIALATALGGSSVLYAGHSAGGLAAALAGSDDSRTVAVLGLDPVDADLGEAATPGLSAPYYAAFGESSFCNSDNNGVAMVNDAPDHRAVRAVDADHCDFENPTDTLCTTFCAGTGALDDAVIQSTIGGLATAFMVWQVGLDAAGEGWWSPDGARWQELLASGVVEEL